jgi:hypothetical protein
LKAPDRVLFVVTLRRYVLHVYVDRVAASLPGSVAAGERQRVSSQRFKRRCLSPIMDVSQPSTTITTMTTQSISPHAYDGKGGHKSDLQCRSSRATELEGIVSIQFQPSLHQIVHMRRLDFVGFRGGRVTVPPGLERVAPEQCGTERGEQCNVGVIGGGWGAGESASVVLSTDKHHHQRRWRRDSERERVCERERGRDSHLPNRSPAKRGCMERGEDGQHMPYIAHPVRLN